VNIAIVNDMRMAVEALRRVVTTVPEYKVIWIARDGAEAVQLCARQRPDLILMDLLMPVMDGVEATRQIMAASPCAILVVTATVSGNSAKVYEAMGHGALDAVNTPILEEGILSPGAQSLLQKIKIIGHLVAKPATSFSSALKFRSPIVSAGFPPLLAIGASTGGPSAVSVILSQLPAEFPASVVVVQHIDEVFADGLASWLDERTALTVRTAAEGGRPEIGVVDVARTNDHLVLSGNLAFNYTKDPEDLPYRPSVDVFFRSMAPLRPNRALAVLLTGIGEDGARGMLKLRQIGLHTIAQDEKTSVVYGMPRAAAELGGAVEVLPVEQIAASILNRFTQKAFTVERKNP